MLPSPPTLSSVGRTELLSAGAWTGSAGLSGLAAGVTEYGWKTEI